ncbi:hypothetical protein CCP3SC1_170001 [Gammaproteobacteria bacterium]
MTSAEWSEAWLDFVLFQVGGYPFALEADQVLAMHILNNTELNQSEPEDSVPHSLSDLLALPAFVVAFATKLRVLEVKCQKASLLVSVEEPVTLQRFGTNVLHPFPEMVRHRLHQPAILALIVSEEKIITLLDSEGLTIPARIDLTTRSESHSSIYSPILMKGE